MIYENYFKRICRKLESAIKFAYTDLALKKVGELKNCEYLITKEHLRKPPVSGYSPLEKGMKWGSEWENMWVKGTAEFTEDVNGRVCVTPHTNAAETLVFIDKVPRGIVNSKGADIINGLHAFALIDKDVKAGTKYEIALDSYAWHFCAGCTPYTNYGKKEADDGEFERIYEGVDLSVIDEDVYGFILDLNMALQLANFTDYNQSANAKAAYILEKVMETVVQDPLSHPEEVWRASIVKCREIMAELFNNEQNDDLGYVGIIGHSHMDTAWLWPVKETIRKCARTYANALNLMDFDPDYKFIQSSALHLDWMREYYPDIFDGIVKRVKEGRYEPNGGVWVECDCNITSGEAMVRQFLYGQRFTRKYMDYTSDCFWLPDTFGYSAAIPQIMKGCDVKYFYTTKMSWGDLNEFPRDTFKWRGIDGSEVITHLHRIETPPDVAGVMHNIKEVKDPAVFNGKLQTFGIGDGGGGPTPSSIENANRVRKVKGTPKVEYTTISDFMKKIEKEANDLKVYDGELYLELHRGTLTQMHDVKRGNRLTELALHTMEFMNVMSDDAVKENIDTLYKTLLLNQFHDILPGTCITPVYDIYRKEIAETLEGAAKTVNASSKKLTEKAEDTLTVFNPAPFKRNTVKLEGNVALEGAVSETYVDVTGKEVTEVYGVDVPAYGAVSYKKADAVKAASEFVYDGKTLETPFYKVKFTENGAISSLFDKENRRETVAKIPFNTIYAGEDVPNDWDNWDIDNDTDKKLKVVDKLISSEVIANGALLFVIRNKYQISYHSTLTQDIIFSSKERKIDFHSVMDWHDSHILVKAGFDIDVSADFMKNEIQFGHLNRPTTRNTSLEEAKFEVVNHKWTDVSEARYGVALLNDCKYGLSGIKTENNSVNLKLSLKKSGNHPDVSGDEGVNEFTYSILPHAGAFSVPTVVADSYLLNIPAVVAEGKFDAEALVTVDADNIICETVKPAEDNVHDYVLRLYEAERSRTNCTISLPGAKKAYITNMLEENKEELTLVDGKAELSFRPFEIKTIYVER